MRRLRGLMQYVESYQLMRLNVFLIRRFSIQFVLPLIRDQRASDLIRINLICHTVTGRPFHFRESRSLVTIVTRDYHGHESRPSKIIVTVVTNRDWPTNRLPKITSYGSDQNLVQGVIFALFVDR